MSARKSFEMEKPSEMVGANLVEILEEASERIRSLYRAETGRELSTEVISLTFEDGRIAEICTDVNEILFEM